jgi:hypothetical protein
VGNSDNDKRSRISGIEWLIALALILCLTVISVYGAHMFIADERADNAGDFDRMHANVLTGNAESPTQYRIGSYLLAHWIAPLFDGKLLWAYSFLRFIFTLASGILLYAFLRRYLEPGWAFGAMAYFYALLPWAYIGYHHQPADPVNLFIFLLGYSAVCSGRPWWLLLIVPVGMVNRETVILLPLFDLLMNFDRKPLGSLPIRAMISIIAGLFVYYLIFSFFGPRDHPDEFIMLYENLRDPLIVLSFGIFLLPLLILSIAGWKHQDTFARRAFGYSVFIIVFYFIFGKFHEMRLFLPILPLLVLTTIRSIQGFTETKAK